MKKLVTILFVLTMIITLLAGCSSSKDKKEKNPNKQEVENNDGEEVSNDKTERKKLLFFAIANIGDYGINDLGYQASQTLAEKYNLDLTLVEGGNDDSTRRTMLLDALETGDYDYCVTASWYIQDYLLEASSTFDTQFILYDTSPLSDFSAYPNVNGVAFRQDQGSFMAAIYQCLMSKNGRVGAAINIDMPITNDFLSGWLAGVKYYNDNYKPVEYTVGYMSEVTVQGDYETVNVLLDSGCDSIYNVGGSVALGAIKAVDEHGGADAGLFVVGVDYDQYAVYTKTDEIDVQGAKLFYTSMEKRIAEMIIESLSNVIDNGIAMGVNHSYTLGEGGVALSENDHYNSVTPQEVKDEIAAVADKINKGEIVVPSYFNFETYEEFAQFRDDPAYRVK